MCIKEKVPKKKKTFNVSLPLHWASLRSSFIDTASTTARNVWNLARAFQFQQELKFKLLTLQFAIHAKFLSALEIFTVALAIKNKSY